MNECSIIIWYLLNHNERNQIYIYINKDKQANKQIYKEKTMKYIHIRSKHMNRLVANIEQKEIDKLILRG